MNNINVIGQCDLREQEDLWQNFTVECSLAEVENKESLL